MITSLVKPFSSSHSVSLHIISAMVKKLESIRDAIVAQSKDRSRPLTVNHVLEQYVELKATLDSLNQEEIAAREPVIRDNALLFALAFMTVGYQQIPAALYAKAFSLHEMLEIAVGELSITPKEENHLSTTIKSLATGNSILDRTDIPDIEYINHLIGEDVNEAREKILTARNYLDSIPELEQPLFIQITHLRRDILMTAVSAELDTIESKFTDLRLKLEKIKAHLDQGDTELSPVTHIQLKNAELFLEWYGNGISATEFEKDSPEWASDFVKLQKAIHALDVLVVTRRWTLRSTDLYPYVADLVSAQPKVLKLLTEHEDKSAPIDFREAPINRYEYIIRYLVRRGWVEIFKLLDSSEPVSEALSSIYNQLLTMRRCLIDVRNAGGISNMRELYPFQMKLNGLDALREDGKFVVDGEIPPGQGVVIEVLAECFDMVYEMKIELDEKGEDDGDESILVDDGDEESLEDDENDGDHGNDEEEGDEEDDYESEGAESSYAPSVSSHTK